MLPDGRVLVAGGFDGATLRKRRGDGHRQPRLVGRTRSRRRTAPNPRSRCCGAARCSRWAASGSTPQRSDDPGSGSWSATGKQPLGAALAAHGNAARRRNGARWPARCSRSPREGAAELYDTGTNNWTPTASMSIDRHWHTATLLPCGEVLAGGWRDGRGHASTPRRSATTQGPGHGGRRGRSPWAVGSTRPRCSRTAACW